jgi:hypothetical protein
MTFEHVDHLDEVGLIAKEEGLSLAGEAAQIGS